MDNNNHIVELPNSIQELADIGGLTITGTYKNILVITNTANLVQLRHGT